MGFWSLFAFGNHDGNREGSIRLFCLTVVWLVITVFAGGAWLNNRPVGEQQKIVNSSCNMSNFFAAQDFPCNATAQEYGWPARHHTDYTNVTDLSNPDYDVREYRRYANQHSFFKGAANSYNGLLLFAVSLIPLGILKLSADAKLNKALRESERKIGPR